jgi:RNA polymerase sigma-B factor
VGEPGAIRRIDGVPESQIFREYRASGNRRLRNQLIEAHRPLAVHLARRFANRTEPLDDLVQVAQVGLLKAVERFDPDRGVAFSSFATPTILGELKRYFRDATWAVRVSRRSQELLLEVNAAVSDMAQELGRPPMAAEIATRLSVREEEVLEAFEVGAAYRSAPLVGAGEQGDDDASVRLPPGVLDPEFEHAEDRQVLGELLGLLPERERQIVYLRFFEERTQTEIAELVGISQMHVSRLLRTSLRRMQDALAAGSRDRARQTVASTA